jgi:hypothetical protein
MRIESSVTSLSWIPSEAVTGPMNKTIFDSGITHYDAPPPDHIADLEALRAADGFRFANHLAGWIDVDDGRIVDAGHAGGGLMGSTTVRIGGRGATFAGVSFADLRPEPEHGDGWVRFTQTTGGHTAVPFPRRVKHPPFVQFVAPTVWTTLTLTLHADGSSAFEMTGASGFPRHWVYDDALRLSAKAGTADFKAWYRSAFGKHTPWGDEDSPALVTEVETALERELASHIMQGGAKPTTRKLKEGALLTEQGSDGDEVYLLLDGVLAVEVDGDEVADVGPGAILGERAALEGGTRTSTLRARTKAKVAVAHAADLDRDTLAEISAGHRREDG